MERPEISTWKAAKIKNGSGKPLISLCFTKPIIDYQMLANSHSSI